ncbi:MULTISPECIES: DHA2 family efflux MFS transporter permease subunit [Rhodopseudomonas]|uniref:DHA2 family efflux MFS transporter permease subunit n=1 Tax=Rhodopseudomonas TaxID=1073 RepID=UPI0009B965A0|nr:MULTISPECIES: DHA2 family efflux MFS transporter permease subunit [Rhodopseudomonas]MDF3814337.1 DHA2 family efflux MFS transporter permease subunit [Rhodopseudomonas sp. BAL398]WOK18033.1 DHA2 family efflux MFS transporter permease subunit [Rhodopseudomonas sp. BAL398]
MTATNSIVLPAGGALDGVSIQRPSGRATAVIAVGALTAAAVMDGLNAIIFDIAGDHMAGTISASPDEAAWLNLAYFMAKVCGLPVTALLLTWLGTRRLLQSAIVLVIIASVGCWLGRDLTVLVLCRALQGLGGAAIIAGGQSWLFGQFAHRRQGLIQAIFALGAIMVPTTAAPAIAGVIVDADSWNAVLLLNVPIGVAVLAVLPLITPPRVPCAVKPDWFGLALICLGLPSLVYVLVEGSRWDWFEDSKIVWLSLIAAATLIGFIIWQRSARNTSPLIDLRIFRHEEFAFGFAVSFVAGFALFGSAFLIPAFALEVLQFPARDAGLVLLPSALTVGLGLLTSGSVIQFLRAPPVAIVPFGIAIFMTAMWLLSGSNAESGYPDLVPTLVLRGFGMGLLFIAITIICLGELTGAEIPHGVGLFNLGRQMGGLIGVAFLATFLDHHMALSRMVIVSNLGQGSPVVTRALKGMEQGFASGGMAPEQATSAALAALNRMVTGQAAAISFNEAFLSVALLFVVAVPCLLVVKASLVLLGHRRREKTSEHNFGHDAERHCRPG